MLGFVSHTVSVATSQLRHCCVKVAIDIGKLMDVAVFQLNFIYKKTVGLELVHET